MLLAQASMVLDMLVVEIFCGAQPFAPTSMKSASGMGMTQMVLVMVSGTHPEEKAD